MSLNVIVRVPNHLGDSIMALPMVNNLSEAYPDSRVTVLVPEGLADVFRSRPGIDDILTIPGEYVHGLKAVMKIRDILSEHEFDVGYILPPSFGAAASFKLGGVKERIGYIADGRRLLLTKPLPLSEPINATHRAEAYFNLLRRGARVDLEFTRPKIFVNDDESRAAVDLLEGFEVGPNDDYVVIAFRAVAESRRWGTERYAALASRLVREYGYRVILVGTGVDREEGEKLVAMVAHAHVINLAGKTSLRELAAIFSRAILFVGNDSGPAHLAAAVGIPLVVISGADDPRETSPLSPHLQRIRLDYLDCIGCVKNVCPLKGAAFMKCQKDVSVDMVFAAVSRLIGNRRK